MCVYVRVCLCLDYKYVCCMHVLVLKYVKCTVLYADGTWPRLQSSHERPHWIMMDFEHWGVPKQRVDDEESEK